MILYGDLSDTPEFAHNVELLQSSHKILYIVQSHRFGKKQFSIIPSIYFFMQFQNNKTLVFLG